MRNRYALALTLACVSSAALAGELDKKEARTMARADKDLSKAEQTLAVYEQDQKPYKDRVAESLERSLGRTAEKLAKLPADGDGVAAALERLKSIRTRVAQLVQAKGTLGAKAMLGAKPAKKINYIVGRLDYAKQELDGFSQGKDFGDRDQDRLIKHLAGVKEELAELPADNAVVKQLAERLAGAERRLAGLRQGLGNAKAAAAEAEAARQALIDGPSFKQDVERVKQLSETFKEFGLFQVDAGHLRNPLDTRTNEQACGIAEQWTQIDAEWKRFAERYASLATGKPNSMFITYKQAQDYHRRMKEAIDSFRAKAPEAAKSAAAEARAMAAKAVAQRDHYAFSNFIGPLRGKRVHVERLAELAQLLGGGAGLDALSKKLDADLQQEEEKLAEEIVAQNRAPADRYGGADRAQLEAFVRTQWKKHFPQERVLAVRFVEDAMGRTVAWRWDRARKQAYKVDHSSVRLVVVVERGDEAILYPSWVRKLHLENDRLILRWSRPKRIPPRMRMLRANF